MKIGICDDDDVWLKKEHDIIKDYLIENKIEYQIYIFHTIKELLDYEDEIDILFMDIQMDEYNGIDAIKAINEQRPHCAVVYVTNYIYYASDVYSTQHSFFVLKEKLNEKIDEIFKKYQHQLSQNRKIIFDIGTSTLALPLEDILYFERHLRITHIHTIHHVYDVKERIGDLEKRLPPIDFIRCHNSYIIYIPAIKILNNDYVVLIDDSEITISRPYKKQVKEAFMKWADTQIL